MPSLDVSVRIAEVLNVSLDHLVVDDIPRRPLTTDSASGWATSAS
jgi:hypothetical protein